MSEEMNKQQEAEVKAEAPAETMEDYAAELEASYKAFDERHFELPEADDAEGEKWAEFAQMMADRTIVKVKITEAVKGGVVAFVDEVRAFIRHPSYLQSMLKSWKTGRERVLKQ